MSSENWLLPADAPTLSVMDEAARRNVSDPAKLGRAVRLVREALRRGLISISDLNVGGPEHGVS